MSQIKYKFGVGTRGDIQITTGKAIDNNGLPYDAPFSVIASQVIEPAKNNSLYINFPQFFYAVEDTVSAVYFYKNTTYIGKQTIKDNGFLVPIPDGATSYNFVYQPTKRLSDGMLAITDDGAERLETFGVYVLSNVEPHYKGLKKQYKKESGQQFFRASLKGDIDLYGCDYQLIKDAGLESDFLFVIYRFSASTNMWIEYYKGRFTKIDCKFNFIKQSCSVKLKTIDIYDNILNKYKDTQDLLKQSPAISQIQIAKRPCVQLYISGGKAISNFMGGTYWETSIETPVDNPGTYKFGHVRTLEELSFKNTSSPNIDGVYGSESNGVFTGPADYIVSIDKVTERRTIIVRRDSDNAVLFRSFDQGNDLQSRNTVNMFKPADTPNLGWVLQKSGGSSYTLSKAGAGSYIFNYDSDYGIYRSSIDEEPVQLIFSEYIPENAYYINIQKKNNSTILFRSDRYHIYNSTSIERLLTDFGNFTLIKVNSPAISLKPDYLFNYAIYGRILCGGATIKDATTGQTESTWALDQNDPFIDDKTTYKRCVNMSEGGTGTALLKNIQIFTARATSDEPTKFGMDDNKKYFTDKIGTLPTVKRLLPICRSSWVNSSIWFAYRADWFISELALNSEYTLKDSFSIAAVISALLKKIDPYIIHEATAEYSQFLYADNSPIAGVTRWYVYLTQKTNILKGEYDQAAQKAEITFEQLMNMLRDCFQCYWYIEDNKFKIEHISFFLGNYSYNNEVAPQLNFSTLQNLYNGLSLSVLSSEIEFDSSALASRYEFSGMDNQTELFDSITIDVKSNYVTKDKTEKISTDKFSSDIDFMLLKPSDFTDDGFALLCPIKDGNTLKLPIIQLENLIDYSGNKFDALAQNWFASFGYLQGLYFDDLPALNIQVSLMGNLLARGIKKCMKYTISFPYIDDLDLHKPIETSLGNGLIEEVSVDLATRQTEVVLMYTPE